MKTFESGWENQEGIKFFVRGWEPAKEPKAVVALVHGLGEHTGRYAHVGQAFSDAGYALVGFDLRGHGKSGGPRGHIPSFEAFMQDIEDFLWQIEERYPQLSCFLYGHSLGGVLVLNYALRRKPKLAGVISTAAGLRTALEEQRLKVVLARVLGTLLPATAIANGLDPKTLSRDPRVVQAYVGDPLVHDRMTLGFGKIMLSVLPWTFEHAHEFSLPLLIMHGEKDMLGYPRGSQEFAALVSRGCTLKIWEGLYHEIHNEPERAKVFKTMLQWMDAHLKSQ